MTFEFLKKKAKAKGCVSNGSAMFKLKGSGGTWNCCFPLHIGYFTHQGSAHPISLVPRLHPSLREKWVWPIMT